MNFSTIKKANWIVATVLLATSGMLATSCSKDKNTPVEQGGEHEGTNLVLSISGINENNENVVKQGSTNDKATKYNVQSFADVDVATAVDNNVPFVSASGIAVKGYNGSSQVAAASSNLRAALVNGVTYRLYLLSSDGTQVISSQQFTVGGTGTTIAVTPGTTYKWVALSYNNEDAIPTITTGNTSLLMPQNKDILYASGNITIPSAPGSNISLPITFNHAFSRLAIELNSMGVFGPMNSGTVAVTGLALRTGTINLATGVVTPETTTFSPTINFSSFTNIDPAYSDAKIVYAYTAGTTAINNIGVSVSNLAITHMDNNSARTYGSVTPINMTFNVTPELGKSHRLLANIVESTLTTPGSTAKWARSNLYYSGTPGANSTPSHNPYRFYFENKITDRADGFFGYKGIIPGVFNDGSVAQSTQDPCALVYPKGLWRQPSLTDIAGPSAQPNVINLVINTNAGNTMVSRGVGGLLGNTLTQILDLLLNTTTTPNTTVNSNPNYVQYTTSTATNPAFATSSNSLRFYYNGQVLAANALSLLTLSSLTVPLGALLEGQNTNATFWTKDDGLNLGIANLGAWSYYGRTYTPLIGTPAFKGLASTEVLSTVSGVGINVLSTTLKNVRCVRN
ncbi:hypothetical protein [Sphingobacterium siyangense]|uniref:hypothetical protein n=1 Tax=Sphingobacterium siyangense TaxID=459529 RepID=UPI003DA4CB01